MFSLNKAAFARKNKIQRFTPQYKMKPVASSQDNFLNIFLSQSEIVFFISKKNNNKNNINKVERDETKTQKFFLVHYIRTRKIFTQKKRKR